MAPESLPTYPVNPKDFLSDLRASAMTTEAFGVYNILLLHSWLERGLPVDQARLRELVKLPPRDFLKAWAQVAPCFTEQDGQLVNPRQERDRLALREEQRQAQVKHDNLVEAGRLHALRRWRGSLGCVLSSAAIGDPVGHLLADPIGHPLGHLLGDLLGHLMGGYLSLVLVLIVLCTERF